MFLQRASVTLLLGPILLILAYIGGWAYFLPFVVVLSLATLEFSQINSRLGWHVPYWLILPSSGLLWFQAQWPANELLSPAFLVSMMLVLGYGLWLYERKGLSNAAGSWFALVSGVVVIGWVGSHVFRIRGLEQLAWQWTILTLLSSWLSDTAAYLVGRFLAGVVLGRHRLSPRLSPNKTVEGYLGGVFVGTSVVVLVAYFMAVPLFWAGILGLMVSTLGPLGDLAISLLKREAGLKDSGRLFPGHGGALDRLDSLIWSMAIGYYLAVMLF